MISETDLAELQSKILTGVTVGIGSQILIFDNGATVLVQCPFRSEIQGKTLQGHGELVYTSEIYYDYLNGQVMSAFLEEGEVLVLEFQDGKLLRVIPESNGLESYVVTTRLGICPVVVV